MVGCYIGLFVKQGLLSRITDLRATKIKTGLGGSSGNKGAVIVRFSLDDTSIVMMNCHLMSGKNKGKQRTDEINYIFDNAFKAESLASKGNPMKYAVENHDVAFIFGDLNYRICLSNEVVRPAVSRKDYQLLKEADELIQAQKQYAGSVDMEYQFFRDFIEAPLDFPPTYKYDKRSQKYDTSKKQRVPSWCDRILWKENADRVIFQGMACLQDIDFSDHRPISAQFTVITHRINLEKTL